MKETPFSNYPYLNLPAFSAPNQENELIEVTDSFDRPLLLVSRSLALRQHLPRRIVQVCLKDATGRIFLQKELYPCNASPGLWDLSVTDEVLAGESSEGAARRALMQVLGVVGSRLRLLSALPYTDAYGAHLHASCYVAGPIHAHPTPSPLQVSDIMFVDEDELCGLVSHQPTLLTFELVWAVRSGWLFM